MVYVQHCSVIDATGEGVHARNTQRILFEEECAIHALRLRSGISASELSAVITYMRGHIGTQYSAREAVLAGLGGARQWSNKQFCSRLVAQAFASAGIHLVADPNFCSPAEIKASPLLVAVPDATTPVSAEEASAWQEADDVPQRMRSAINAGRQVAWTRFDCATTVCRYAEQVANHLSPSEEGTTVELRCKEHSQDA